MGMVLRYPTQWLVMGALAAYAGTANAASLSLESEAEVPTQHFSPLTEQQSEFSDSLTWISFTQAALPGARPMHDWERQDVDEFFWSQFQ